MANSEDRHPSIITRGVHTLMGVAVFAMALPLVILPIWAVVAFTAPILDWLKTGAWPSNSFWNGIEGFFGERPEWGWVIPNRVLQFALDAPLWLALISVWAAYFAAFSFFATKWDEFRKDHPAIRDELVAGWLSLSSRAKLLWLGFLLYWLVGWLVAYWITGDADDAGLYPFLVVIFALQIGGLCLLIWRGIRMVGKGFSRLFGK